MKQANFIAGWIDAKLKVKYRLLFRFLTGASRNSPPATGALGVLLTPPWSDTLPPCRVDFLLHLKALTARGNPHNFDYWQAHYELLAIK
jgi:hypothetical protein